MPRVAVAVKVGAEPANVLHVSYISQTEKFAERGKWYKGVLRSDRKLLKNCGRAWEVEEEPV